MIILMQIGHSDELMLVDPHFSGYLNAKRYYNAAGLKIKVKKYFRGEK